MAADIQTQVIRGRLGVAIAVGLAIAIAPSCGEGEAAANGTKSVTDAAAAESSKGEQRTAEPIADGDPAEAIRLLLKRCHGPAMSAADMASLMVNLFADPDVDIEAPDPRMQIEKDSVKLGSPRLMWIKRHDRSETLCNADGTWRREWRRKPYVPIRDGKTLSELVRLQALIRAVLLEPLYEAKDVKRVSGTVFTLETKRGESWRLEVRPFTTEDDQTIILPATLDGPHGLVKFTRYDFHGISNMPRVVSLGEFGEKRFVPSGPGQIWRPKTFASPK